MRDTPGATLFPLKGETDSLPINVKKRPYSSRFLPSPPAWASLFKGPLLSLNTLESTPTF